MADLKGSLKAAGLIGSLGQVIGIGNALEDGCTGCTFCATCAACQNSCFSACTSSTSGC